MNPATLATVQAARDLHLPPSPQTTALAAALRRARPSIAPPTPEARILEALAEETGYNLRVGAPRHRVAAHVAPAPSMRSAYLDDCALRGLPTRVAPSQHIKGDGDEVTR